MTTTTVFSQGQRLVALSALCAGFLALTGCAKLQSRDHMNNGVQAYKNNHYADAVKQFKQAVELDPSNQNAELYLATSYMIQWVPGVEAPDNQKNYDMAKTTFDQVLQRDPANSLALASRASMAYNSAISGTPEQKNAALEEAKKWNLRRIEVDPKEAEPYYYLGVIDWSQAFTPIQSARVELRMKGDDPGPIKDEKVKAELKEKYGKAIEDGIANLKKALEVDKENEDAMSYMNLLLRKKADLEDSVEAAKADIAQAEDWSNKSLDMKKIKAARPQKSQAT
ncbi:MAG TPA: tetratricopeptide repeat protein [Bryobacteraceae bacterium]|nr:tetratricopeptide repeat protein [Bryobacteraceae bacterium]